MTLDCIVKPAGLRAPPMKRLAEQEDYLKPILEAFESYRGKIKKKDFGNSWEKNYALATKLIKYLAPPAQSFIDEFIIHFQDDAVITDVDTGLFISALYNRSDQNVLTYNHDLPLNCLGFRLSKTKLLIINRSVGDYCCLGSSGLVVLNRTAGDFFGSGSSGLLLINGSAGTCLGEGSSGLIVINGIVGECCGHWSSGFILETKQDCLTRDVRDGDLSPIFYSELIRNKKLYRSIQHLIKPLAKGSLEPAELEKFIRPAISSAIVEIMKFYNQ